MFHLNPKPRPPAKVGADTPDQAVLFGDHERAGMGAIDFGVGALQELDGFEVVVAAELVGYPLPRLARIVEVEHRGDRIDAKAVDMELLEPVERVVDEEGRHFLAPKIVDRRVPVGMVALARIGMLVERRSIEIGEPVLVGREMRRHPIEDDADARLVRSIDEVLEGSRIAEA